MSATYVFDLTDAATDETHSIYRCDICHALVEALETEAHEGWHRDGGTQ